MCMRIKQLYAIEFAKLLIKNENMVYLWKKKYLWKYLVE